VSYLQETEKSSVSALLSEEMNFERRRQENGNGIPGSVFSFTLLPYALMPS